MKHYQSLNHTTWDCKYHLVWIPKWRRKILYGQLRKHLGEVFRGLALHREAKVLEGHLIGDHVHMLLSIPPKYSVSQVVGYVKGKSAIHIARTYTGTGVTSYVRISGPGVTTYQLQVEMRRPSARTSRSKKRWTGESTNKACLSALWTKDGLFAFIWTRFS